MNRREHLLNILGLGILSISWRQVSKTPIQLHVDLNVNPSREPEMIDNYRNIFEPAIRRQPGFVEVKLLKLRERVIGESPAEQSTHRLIISFETEEDRRRWVASEEHQRVWPEIEKTLIAYTASLYDVV